MTRSDDRDGRPTGMECRGMCRAVDTDREPRHDACPDRRQVRGQARRNGPAVIGRPPRPDDAQRRPTCRGRRDRPARTARAAACRSRRAGPGMPGRRASRSRGPARGSARGWLQPSGSPPRSRPQRRRRRDRPGFGPPRAGSERPPGASCRRRTPPRAGWRSRCRSEPSNAPNPTGPSPRTPARTAQASRSSARGRWSWLRSDRGEDSGRRGRARPGRARSALSSPRRAPQTTSASASRMSADRNQAASSR